MRSCPRARRWRRAYCRRTGSPWPPDPGERKKEPCSTMGKPGRRRETSSSTSKRSWGLVPGLNLYAPWLVPMAIAEGVAPGLGHELLHLTRGGYREESSADTLTSSSMPARVPSSASTTTPWSWAYSTTLRVRAIFSAKRAWRRRRSSRR